YRRAIGLRPRGGGGEAGPRSAGRYHCSDLGRRAGNLQRTPGRGARPTSLRPGGEPRPLHLRHREEAAVTEVFADSFYWIALANEHDQWHAPALAAGQTLGTARLVTTEAVLMEFLAA